MKLFGRLREKIEKKILKKYTREIEEARKSIIDDYLENNSILVGGEYRIDREIVDRLEDAGRYAKTELAMKIGTYLLDNDLIVFEHRNTIHGIIVRAEIRPLLPRSFFHRAWASEPPKYRAVMPEINPFEKPDPSIPQAVERVYDDYSREVFEKYTRPFPDPHPEGEQPLKRIRKRILDNEKV